MSEDDSDDDTEPALRHFSRTAFIATHTIKATAIGGVIGGVVGGAALGGLTAVGGLAALSFIPVVGPILAGGALLTGIGSGLVVSAATTGAMWGAGIGATIKGALGLGNASEAADREEDRLITKAQQADMRRNRMLTIEHRRDMQQRTLDAQTDSIRGSNPNRGLPRRVGSAGMEATT